MSLTAISDLSSTLVETEICILGAGPAGITCALELSRRGHQVVLLEGGGLQPPEDRELDLYDGVVSGARTYPLAPSRLRYFGGTSGHWGGWCRPLDPIDFETKPHIPHSGWPISRSDLDPWYRQAHEWVQIDQAEYYDEQAFPAPSTLLPAAHGMRTKYFRFSPPTRFGEVYLGAVKEAETLQCVLNATATHFDFDSNGSARVVYARSLDGHSVAIRAGSFVVALGGIENARYLLGCADQEPAAPWRDLDWLGRGFMDHAGWQMGSIIAKSGLQYRVTGKGAERVMPVLTIEDDLLREGNLINCCLILQPLARVKGLDSTYGLNSWVGAGTTPGDVSGYRAALIWEPSPCRTSQVSLSDKRDALGMKRLDLFWDFNNTDFDMLDASISHINQYLHLAKAGRLKLDKPVNAKNIAGRIGNGWHHMGTTRMSDHPSAGVVDRHCKVHGSDNVYVAGSSVFPSVGFSNPTLTITALACRLAAHLSETIGQSR